jgi:hypothetical protein
MALADQNDGLVPVCLEILDLQPTISAFRKRVVRRASRRWKWFSVCEFVCEKLPKFAKTCQNGTKSENVKISNLKYFLYF